MVDIFRKIYKNNKSKVLLLSIMTVITSILGIGLPYLNGKFIDTLINLKEINQIIKLISLIIILGGLNIVFNYIYQIVSSKLIIKSIYDLRIDILKHLRKIPILQYKEFDPVYMNERTRKDVSDVVNIIVNNYMNMFIKLIIFITCLFVVGYLNITTLLCIALIVPIYIIIYNYYSKNIYSSSFKVKENENVFFKIYNEQLQLMEEIKIDSKYENHDNYVNYNFMNYFKSFSEYISLSTRFNTVESIISLVFQAVLFIFGAISILKNRMSIGDLTIINSYFAIMIGIINYYVSLGKMYQESKVSIDRLKKIHDIKEEENGELKLENINKIDIDLNFSYRDGYQIINNKRAIFSSGKIYAIQGSNGSGKTTLAKLIIGLYHPNSDSSSIKYNDEPIENVDIEFVRDKKIAFVSQKHKMTNKKVKELFTEIDRKVNIDSIIKYLKFFNDEKLITESIELVKKFWNNAYYELSEGEKQIISIIRVLCKNPDVLILDEPTSNLDFEKGKFLEKILENIKNKMIIIIISHDKQFLDISDEVIDLNSR
jgi:ABC transporter related